ncbi:MAG: prepilin-type N-terminal cleavage/methylation domain-containing protein [Phycisphaerales bacterium]
MRKRLPCAFTLVELLIVVVLLGIAGALVIPNMASAHSLRVQAALRTIASDLTFAQADAIAFQRRRAIVFDVPNNRYRIVDIPGSAVSDDNTLFKSDGPGGLYVVDLNEESFAGARIVSASFAQVNGLPTLIYDDVGSPAAAATGDQPGLGGIIRLSGSNQTFDIIVEPYTGRVSTRRVVNIPLPPAPEPEPAS